MAVNAQVRIVRLSLTSANAGQLAKFYEDAFGCTRVASVGPAAPYSPAIFRAGGRTRNVRLRLGQEKIELLQFEVPGAAYPDSATASDLMFQHFAVVVADMAKAWEHLRGVPGWTAITRGSPQKLPLSAGAVTAFKFRDPEGHPLELLEFPRSGVPEKWAAASPSGLFLGIDHTAVSVSDTAASISFYEELGFRKAFQSHNRGAEQAALDGLRRPDVDVTAMLGPSEPHIELLCYRYRERGACAMACNDIAATRVVLRSDIKTSVQPQTQLAFDPDGHRLLLEF